MLPDLADACRKSGLHVVELPRWETRGRPGSFAPRGVLVHHTGGTADDRGYVDWMALTGRSDLPAPLCQLALSRGGTVYVCAAGRSNHGGVAKASGPMPAGDANVLYIGIEALNTGSEGWSATQYDAYVRLCRALIDHYGWKASAVRAHKETSVTGKWDPGLLDMDKFRTDIRTANLAKTVEDDMPTPDQLWSHPIPVYEGKNGPKTRRAQVVVAQTHSRATSAVDLANECAKGIKDLAGLIGDTGLSDADRRKLAAEVAERTAAAVKRLDAAAVAEQLEVTVKDES